MVESKEALLVLSEDSGDSNEEDFDSFTISTPPTSEETKKSSF
jgi:hypothetical protein